MIGDRQILLTASALGLLASWLLRGDDATDAPAASEVASAVPAAASTPPPPARGDVVVAKTTAPAPAAPSPYELRLPDGSTVPTLNGATDAPPLQEYWGPFPWSPIVGTERNDVGFDWYRHADGSYSTTQMVWRADLGRMAAMTRVGHPGPAPAPTAATH